MSLVAVPVLERSDGPAASGLAVMNLDPDQGMVGFPTAQLLSDLSCCPKDQWLSAMSHSPIEFSPSGTPLLDRTVGELVAERPGRSRVFHVHNIGFCCQGRRTLRQACELKGVSPEQIARELEREDAAKGEPEKDLTFLSPAELCEYIVETHHRSLRQELPRLHAMAERVSQVHGGHTPSLVSIYQVFHSLYHLLADHVEKCEQGLFPAIARLNGSPKTDFLGEDQVTVVTDQHKSIIAALGQLQELTDGYQPPVDACNTYRALFAGLLDLEAFMLRHIHLERSLLFPSEQARVAAESS